MAKWIVFDKNFHKGSKLTPNRYYWLTLECEKKREVFKVLWQDNLHWHNDIVAFMPVEERPEPYLGE